MSPAMLTVTLANTDLILIEFSTKAQSMTA
jgi:hypothetical protein